MEWIYELFDSNIKSISTLSGGDTAQVFKVTTQSDVFVLKSSNTASAENLLLAEVTGLKQIEATKTIATPPSYAYGTIGTNTYLILEWIPQKTPDAKAMEQLGSQLAALHSASGSNTFGSTENNYIGTLKQVNTIETNWGIFFSKHRLNAQLILAKNLGYLSLADIPSLESMEQLITNYCGDIKPSLLHGDLWSGNYLIHENGTPYLIDPSVYYGHNQVDLAMSKLFGGFSNSFYEAYHNSIPPHKNENALTEIYQLYYLLVHLNIFGNSYRNSVQQLLKRYFF